MRRDAIGEEGFHQGMASLVRDLHRERVAEWVVRFLRRDSTG
jgi:hypothetical protein